MNIVYAMAGATFKVSKSASKTVSRSPQVDRISSVEAKLKKLIMDKEVKSFDVTDVAGTTTVANSQIIQLSGVAQGDGEQQREGNQLTPINFRISGYITSDLNKANYRTFLRVMLVRDNDPMAGTPTISSLLENVTDGGICVSPLNYLNIGRYTVFYDKTMKLNPNDEANVSMLYQPFMIQKKVNGKIYFSGASGSNTRKGHYYLVVCSDSTADPPFLNYTSRMRFTDSA